MDHLLQLATLTRSGYRHPARTHDGSIVTKALVECVAGASLLGLCLVALAYGSDHEFRLLQVAASFLMPVAIGLMGFGMRTSWMMTARRCRFRVTAFNLAGSLATLVTAFGFAVTTSGFNSCAFIGALLMTGVLGVSAFLIAGALIYPIGLGLDYIARPRGKIQLLGCGGDHERTD